MEPLITSYGIDYTKFRNVITSTKSLVAGSSALAGYLIQERIDPKFVPGDIDIWVPCTCPYNQYRNVPIFRDFLLSSGFTINTDNSTNRNYRRNYSYGTSLKHIMNIINLVNSRGQKVQLIELFNITPYRYILKAFDLSICITWWNASSDCFETKYPNLTKKKQSMYMYKGMPKYINVTRMQKYKARGFEFIPPPCHIHIEKDERLELDSVSEADYNPFTEKTAFDLIEFEDVNVIDYLKASEWNIILKIKDTSYAFRRKDIIKIMYAKKTQISSLKTSIVDTPFNQSLHIRVLDMLTFSDYSIYELEYRDSIEFRGNVKSIYDMKCYSIKDYISGKPSKIIRGPTRSNNNNNPIEMPLIIINV